ncbi:MAG: oligosaccharide flippase family protein [Bacteroidetes bacterium]|nr:oligosaccharide flippase family protein [Bacteroidota bacterium]MBL0097860.1 oligosaccharide flippase family protein [Bacteroidota bacterium]
MKKLLGSFIKNKHTLSLAGNITNAILGFGSIALVARLLTKEDMGAWFMFMTAYIFADLLRAGIIHTSLIRFAASSENDQFKVVSGSGWLISIITTLIISILTLITDIFFGHLVTNEGFGLFLTWYWLAAITTLPFNYAAWLLQAKSSFEKVLYIRLLNQLSFITCILLALITERSSVNIVLGSFIISGLLPSSLSLWAGWSMISTVKFATKKMMKDLFNFGKFSMGTLMGSNLLRSSDTLIIGFMLSAKDLASYSIPLKLIEVIEILLRSFAASAMPVLSKFRSVEQKAELRTAFYRYTGLLSLLILPIIGASILFADSLVVLLGGEQYAESAYILRILAVYAAFLPLDRFSGITLDIIGKPYLNFLKVILMLIVNVTGDIIAITYFGNIGSIAAVSILTFLTGVIFGNYFLKKYLNHSIKETLKTGFTTMKHILQPLLERFKSLRVGNTTS